jgi:hypothetical protein
MAMVVDVSVGLKWVLPEPGSFLAKELMLREPDLVVADFWLHEATNILWLPVREGRFTACEARKALALLRAQLAPTPTADMALHEVALDIGIELNHSTYNALYLGFAVAMGASALVLADGPFVRAMRGHAHASLAALPLPLETGPDRAAWPHDASGSRSKPQREDCVARWGRKDTRNMRCSDPDGAQSPNPRLRVWACPQEQPADAERYCIQETCDERNASDHRRSQPMRRPTLPARLAHSCQGCA